MGQYTVLIYIPLIALIFPLIPPYDIFGSNNSFFLRKFTKNRFSSPQLQPDIAPGYYCNVDGCNNCYTFAVHCSFRAAECHKGILRLPGYYKLN